VEAQPFHRKSEPKAKHPQLPELLGGVSLGAAALKSRSDAGKLAAFIDMVANAEYWLSFDLSSFEPLLERSPSPFRELAVGIALRFGEGVDGSISLADVERAKTVLEGEVASDLKAGVQRGLDTLERAVRARDDLEEFVAEGFEPHAPSTALSVHALMAAGRAKIVVKGADAGSAGNFQAEVGRVLELSASDDRGKTLEPPEIESELGAPVWAKKSDTVRTVVLVVPGRYRLRVPGRSEGTKALIAT
jgi:hypothetical protein